MAALAPSATPRFKCLYTQLSHQHEAQIRSTQSPSVVGVVFDALFSVLTGAVASLTIDEVQFAPSGSDIFNPVTTGIEGNTYGISGHPASDVATYWGLVGRTAGGKRCRFYIFGMGGMGVDYRYGPGENTAADSFYSTMQSQGTKVIAIDGLVPVWKSYVNAGVNRLWIKNLRP
jgi:hypothetical protein